MNFKESTVFNCSVLQLTKIHNRSGNITIVENNVHVPFEIKRVYYLYDIPGGESRGGHAHRELHQLIVAASGSFNVILNDGKNIRVINLNRPYFGLYIIPGIWRELVEFSSGAICLVLASDIFKENDYIRDYSEFINFKHNNYG
ncbi:MAG: WxcM-like domain-containing protein [Spirochaetales bacterium]|nr:WxcM-like domain-containing protein [Spirochaetales bacterium]